MGESDEVRIIMNKVAQFISDDAHFNNFNTLTRSYR